MEEGQDEAQPHLDQLPIVTYVADLAWERLLTVSPRISGMVGYHPSELVGDVSQWADRMHPADRYRVLHEIAEARVNGASFASEYRVMARNGQVVWVRDEAVLVRGEDGAPRQW